MLEPEQGISCVKLIGPGEQVKLDYLLELDEVH